MWSQGSLELSYDSNCGRWNFDGKGQFSTSMVNGESILRIIPSKFSLPLSFMALFNLSISFLMLRSSFFILEESSPEVLSHLLAWEFDSSSFWFSTIMFCVLGFHCLSQLFILAIHLFHISQKGLDLLLLHSFWLLCSFWFHLILQGSLLSLGKMAWMISVSHRRCQNVDAKNQQLSSSS